MDLTYLIYLLLLLLLPSILTRVPSMLSLWWNDVRTSYIRLRSSLSGFYSSTAFSKSIIAFMLGVAVTLVVVIGVKQLPNIPWIEIPSIAPQVKASAVVYIYEKDSGTIVPPLIAVGINKLNEQNIVATTFEKDSTDGTQQVPDQYKKPLEEALKIGLPALVVSSDKGDVLKVIKAPTTEAQVIDSVK